MILLLNILTNAIDTWIGDRDISVLLDVDEFTISVTTEYVCCPDCGGDMYTWSEVESVRYVAPETDIEWVPEYSGMCGHRGDEFYVSFYGPSESKNWAHVKKWAKKQSNRKDRRIGKELSCL